MTHAYFGAIFLKINQKTFEESVVRFELFSNLIVTKGKDGCDLIINGETQEINFYNIESMVQDSIGAGDSFFAAFICAYCESKSIVECCEFANLIAYESCKSIGTI